MYYWAKIIKNNDYNTFKKNFFILKFHNPSYLFPKQFPYTHLSHTTLYQSFQTLAKLITPTPITARAARTSAGASL